MSYNGMFVIFGIYRVDLHNRILISTGLGDLHFSASSTARPKIWRPIARPRGDSRDFQMSKWVAWDPIQLRFFVEMFWITDMVDA